MHMKKLMSFLLAAMMVLPAVVSCKKDKKPGNPSVKTQEATEIEAYSARLHAWLDFADVQWGGVNYGFIWGTAEDTEGTYIEGKGILTESGAYWAEITGLTPETDYWFKAYVEIDDQPYTGEILHFMTAISPVPDVAVDLGTVMTREDGTTYKLYWAKSNLCETGLCANPEDYGDYYAWGETDPYYSSQDPLTWRDGKTAGYDWASYKWCNGSTTTLTKYNTSSSWGSTVDNITELQRGEKEGETKDDVARAKLGGEWRMPTDAEWTALREKCIWASTEQNGINGRLVTASNGNSIFLPAAGYVYGVYRLSVGFNGRYWSSSLRTDYPSQAWRIFFESDPAADRAGGIRYYGFSVRPVWEE